MALAFFKYFGKMLTKMISWGAGLSSKMRGFKTNVISATGEVFIFAVFGFIFLIIIPASIFQSIQQNWNYFDSFYYCVMTLTTVGFGDFVPGMISNDSLNDFYRICAGCWIFIGLSYLFIIIERIQKKIEEFAGLCCSNKDNA